MMRSERREEVILYRTDGQGNDLHEIGRFESEFRAQEFVQYYLEETDWSTFRMVTRPISIRAFQ